MAARKKQDHIFSFKQLAAQHDTDPKFYDRVVRFKRGERNSLKKSEIAALKKAAKIGYDALIAELNECIPNDIEHKHS